MLYEHSQDLLFGLFYPVYYLVSIHLRQLNREFHADKALIAVGQRFPKTLDRRGAESLTARDCSG